MYICILNCINFTKWYMIHAFCRHLVIIEIFYFSVLDIFDVMSGKVGELEDREYHMPIYT